MENVYRRLAAALERHGIAHDAPIPHGMASVIAAEVGLSMSGLKGRKWQLKKAGSDPDAARLANAVRRRGKEPGVMRRYHSDPSYRAARLLESAAERRRNYVYHVFKNTRGNAKRRGLPFELTREQVAEMLRPMRCAATGLPLLPEWDCPGRANPWWPSLDQIDPCGGYRSDNVRVVCWAYNVMKGELDDATVRRFASALVKGAVRRDKKAADALAQWRTPQWGSAKPRTAACRLRTQWKESARERGLDYALTTEDVRCLLSPGVCSVTGLPLSMSNSTRAFRNPLVPSLDRLDCARGYAPDNVRLVCCWYNYARQDWPDGIVHRVAEGLLRASVRPAGGSRIHKTEVGGF